MIVFKSCEKFDNSFFSCLFASLRLGFSCLGEYLFKINHIASPFSKCGLDFESVTLLFVFVFVLPQVHRMLMVMSSLPLLLLFSVKCGHRVSMLGKLIFYCTVLNL